MSQSSRSRHRQGSLTQVLASVQKKIKKLGFLAPAWQACIPLAILIVGATALSASAQAPTTEQVASDLAGLKVGLDTMWVMVAAMLVFFMNAGFCMLETGFCRQKNAVNVLAKNLIVFSMASIAFWILGFGLMFGNGNGVIGADGLFVLSGLDNSPATGDAYQGAYSSLSWAGVPLLVKFFFQLAFAGTAATIVSGAVAERIKFVGFLAGWYRLSFNRTLDLGRWLASKTGILGLCWLNGGAFGRWLGSIDGCSFARITHWQVQLRWQH